MSRIAPVSRFRIDPDPKWLFYIFLFFTTTNFSIKLSNNFFLRESTGATIFKTTKVLKFCSYNMFILNNARYEITSSRIGKSFSPVMRIRVTGSYFSAHVLSGRGWARGEERKQIITGWGPIKNVYSRTVLLIIPYITRWTQCEKHNKRLVHSFIFPRA